MKKVLITLCLLAIVTVLSAQDVQRIEDLNLGYVSQPYGKAIKNGSITEEKISVNGTIYESGIGTHSNSLLKLKLNGAALKFMAKVALTSSSYKISDNDIISIPLGDGKRTFYKSNGETKQ